MWYPQGPERILTDRLYTFLSHDTCWSVGSIAVNMRCFFFYFFIVDLRPDYWFVLLVLTTG